MLERETFTAPSGLAAVLMVGVGVVYMSWDFPDVGVPLIVVGGVVGVVAIGSMVGLARHGRPR